MVAFCSGIAIALIVVAITAYFLGSKLKGRKYDILIMCWLIIKEFSLNVFNVRRKYNGKKDLTGKVVVITGANTGIGKITAKEIGRRNAKVIIGCRDVDKGNKAIEDIKKEYPNANIRLIKLDLSSLESVRQFAKQVSDEEKQIDILINNAGVMACPKWTTEDGYEMQFASNSLGHFLLTMLLLDRLNAAPKARILFLSSKVYMAGTIDFDDIYMVKSYNPILSYSRSKLANILFAKELARLLSTTNITTYSLHPGIIRTDLGRHNSYNKSLPVRIFERIVRISPDLGIQTTLYCALDDSVANESGYYYDDCQRVDNMASNVNDANAKKLWDLSCDLVKLEDRLRLN